MICYDYVNEYIRKTIKGNDGILLELESYADANHIPIIQPEVGRLLVVLGCLLKPQYILEVGTAIGYSAILLSNILASGGRIDTIDRYDIVIDRARANIEKAGLTDVINVIEGDASDVLRHLDRKYDMIFLDGAKGQYVEFLPECLRMLGEGGVLISDNVLYKGMVANDNLIEKRKKTIVKRMRDYLEHICTNNELETTIIPIGDGVAVSYRK